ncbi:hypothetical protein HK099_006768 [Clydaea vesicula]|uniref:Alkyl transferase n=1 Tax=Clydaea vesicula TaxID=447962 RepID=A0AAD5TX90_9FUNG|nr:hypothetical protein HK099_006768 [Clydaea vesicula]
MDGNRRFAKTSGMKTAEGHLAGFSTLEDTLNWSLKLGVKCVTVYAFSVENFKRPQEEVDNLMELAEEKFNAFAHNSDFIKKNEISVRVLGELELLPPKIRKAAINVTKSTSHHKNAIFNICFPYTSFLEIEDAALEIINGIKSNDINKDDVSEEFFNKLLYTGDCPPVDILIRTSGEIRFSDFLLWQCSDKCSVHFLDCYWPDFSFWDMLPIILQFQALFTPLKEESNPLPNAKITEFLEKIRLKKRLQGEELH